jgi:hypothetical protein
LRYAKLLLRRFCLPSGNGGAKLSGIYAMLVVAWRLYAGFALLRLAAAVPLKRFWRQGKRAVPTLVRCKARVYAGTAVRRQSVMQKFEV